MPSSIFNGDSVKILKDILKFKAGKRIVSSSVDPSAVATAGEPGDVLINSSKIFVKKDAGISTNWDEIIDSAELVSQLANYVLVAEKGANNGVATLDAGGKLTSTQVPAIAITDTFVVASQAAQTALTAEVGDVAVRTDLNKSFILASEPASSFANWQELLSPTDAVLSVFSRTGVVTAQAGDYSANQVTNVPAGNLAANNIQDAVNELQTDIDNRALTADLAAHITDPTDAHDASAISSVPSGNLAATDVQSALNELQTNIDVITGGKVLTSAIAGENLNARDALYIASASDSGRTAGQAYKLNVANINRIEFIGFAENTVTSGNSVSIVVAGPVTGFSGLTVGQPIFASSSVPGSYQTTAPTGTGEYIIQLGGADSATSIIMNGSGSATAVQVTEEEASSGSTGINFITGGDAEGAQIFTVYNDSSTTRPVDGTGGTQANLAVNTSGVIPLAGTNSFTLTKSGAASTQGSGISTSFSIDPAYRAKVLQVEFDYIVNSGTFVAGSSSAESDVIVYIFDVTNSQLIEPSSIKFLSNSSTIADKFVANFQTSATGASYRLILHCRSTSSSNYELKLDNFKISPSNYVFGTPITDWTSYTPTFANVTLGSGSSVTGVWRRVGDNAEIRASLTLGSSGASVTGYIGVGLPSGLSVNTAKISITNGQILGDSNAYDVSAGTGYAGLLQWIGARNQLELFFGGAGGDGSARAVFPFTWANSDTINVHASIPIVGWSSSVQVSDGFDGRSIVFIAADGQPSGTIASTFSGSGAVIFDTKAKDTTASYNTSNGEYTITTSGDYVVTGMLTVTGSFTVGQRVAIAGYLDGALQGQIKGWVVSGGSTSSLTLSFNQVFAANAGQKFTIRCSSDVASPAFINSADQNSLMIYKLSAPTTISATEVVAAGYRMGTAQSLNASATIKWDTKDVDTHNMFNAATGQFVLPVAGIYEVSSQMISINATGQSQLTLRLNNSGVIRTSSSSVHNGGSANTANQQNYFLLPYQFSATAGTTVDILVSTLVSGMTLYASTADNWISLKRIK